MNKSTVYGFYEESGSAERTAIEHLDRSIEVIKFITVPYFTISLIYTKRERLRGLVHLPSID